jgi:hypothetical protein
MRSQEEPGGGQKENSPEQPQISPKMLKPYDFLHRLELRSRVCRLPDFFSARIATSFLVDWGFVGFPGALGIPGLPWVPGFPCLPFETTVFFQRALPLSLQRPGVVYRAGLPSNNHWGVAHSSHSPLPIDPLALSPR